MVSLKRRLVSLTGCGFLATAAHAQVSFTGLGFLANDPQVSIAYGLSGDGLAVVGESRTALGWAGFLWRFPGSMTNLGHGNSTVNSAAYGVSDGATGVVGFRDTAARWTPQNGWIGITGHPDSLARAVSADGSVTVGHVLNKAIRHTTAGGIQYLGTLAPELASYALGVSGDGAVITGYGATSVGPRAFRWTQDSGMVNIGSIAGGANDSMGLDVSADGSTIVGWSGSPGGTQAVLWNPDNSIVQLGFLSPSHLQSRALGVSLGGAFVVGTSLTSSGYRAFLWDSDNGMRDLKAILTSEYGLNLSGWTLLEAIGISDDGLTIAGNGVNPQGRNEAWIVHVPAPGSGVVLLALAVTRRRRR